MIDPNTTSEIASDGGTLRNVVNIFAAPGEAFRSLKERPTLLLPLAALLIATCAVTLWYYASVDLVWLTERSLDAARAQLSAAQRQQLLENVGKVSPYVRGGILAAVSAIVQLILLVLGAGYLSIVSSVTNDGFRFRNWFSLGCWSSLPIVLSRLAIMVNLTANDATHLAPERLDPLSLSNLLGLEASTGVVARFLQSADLTSFWALALMIVGYSSWTRKGLGPSAAIVAGPLLVIVAIVLAIAL